MISDLRILHGEFVHLDDKIGECGHESLRDGGDCRTSNCGTLGVHLSDPPSEKNVATLAAL